MQAGAFAHYIGQLRKFLLVDQYVFWSVASGNPARISSGSWGSPKLAQKASNKNTTDVAASVHEFG